MILEKLSQNKLFKIVALGQYGSKIERVFNNYKEGKDYGLFLESNNYIVMYEPLVHITFDDLAQEYLNKLEDMEASYTSQPQSTLFH